MDKNLIKKVHLVYKTHLDIGFTNLSSVVIEQYLNDFIPASVDLALEMNTPEQKKFIWTLGSYLIDLYIKTTTPENLKKIEEAISKGYIRWHGLSCTTHTELMNEDLLKFSLEISKKLDEKYGVTTIASKMTDVPGHTIAIVSYLKDYGIEYLHIGVNASSKIPEVPEVFRWHNEGKEIIVNYAASYGLPLLIDGFDEVLEFAHTGDNRGPQSKEEIEEDIKRIEALYPNAIVEASTLDNYAKSLIKIKDKLPLIDEEIGDTWIHGTGTDPVCVGYYKELLKKGKEWLASGQLNRDSEEYNSFMMNLLLIPEHTWGVDFKKYLADFTNWTKTDFNKAREEDVTTLEFLSNRNSHMLDVLNSDLAKYRDGKFTGSYKFFEEASNQQRMYIKRAIEALPTNLKNEANEIIENQKPIRYNFKGEKLIPNVEFTVGGWNVKILSDGSIGYLSKDGRVWNDGKCLGLFQYEVFNFLNCTNHYHRYNRDFNETSGWSEPDFSKPGLEFVEDLKNRCYLYAVGAINKVNNKVCVDLHGDSHAVSKFGAPKFAQIIYTFEESEIGVELNWFEKDANKIPEALWFHFNFEVANPNRWKMQKINKLISPLDVVVGGNRKQHSVEKLVYQGADGEIEIESCHSPLVSIGGRNIYEADEKFNDLENGFYFALFNNRWGTNFKMWCEDDCKCKYVVRFKSYK